MTEQHPITPPPELVQQWINEEGVISAEYLAAKAARWGADQEMEACIDAIARHPGFESPELFIEVLRAARRPKPPSRADAALKALEGLSLPEEAWTAVSFALERLQELESKP